MTKAELEKEATTYALEWGTTTDGTYACCRDGYLAGAEPREKRIAELEEINADLKQSLDWANERESEDVKRIEELEAQIEKMKKELHHRLVSPSKNDSDCLDKIVGLDRLWQFGEEF